MRKFDAKYTFILCIVLLGVGQPAMQSEEERKKALSAFDSVQIPSPKNINAFGVGEYLDFGVYVSLPGVGTLPIMGGHGILEVPTIVDWAGNSCFLLRSKAYSTGVVGQVYPVMDIIESFMDVDSFYSWFFRKDVKESSFRDKYSIRFDQRKHRAIREGHFDVETYLRVQDILSAFYFVRTLDFEPGDTIPVPFHDNGGNYPILVVIHRREEVEVPAGKFNSVVVEPILKVEGLFKRKGRMFIWLTDDSRKMPVKMVSEIPVGKVIAELLEYREGDRNWR